MGMGKIVRDSEEAMCAPGGSCPNGYALTQITSFCMHSTRH